MILENWKMADTAVWDCMANKGKVFGLEKFITCAYHSRNIYFKLRFHRLQRCYWKFD
jgi:hypothetical protein